MQSVPTTLFPLTYSITSYRYHDIHPRASTWVPALRVGLGNPIVLDGNASSDPNTAAGDSIVSYQWNIASGTFSHSGVTPSLTATQVNTLGTGTHSVSLTVTDEFGTTGTTSTTLSIYDNTPVAAFTASGSVRLGWTKMKNNIKITACLLCGFFLNKHLDLLFPTYSEKVGGSL